MLEGARNLVAGRGYVVIEASPGGEHGRTYVRLSKAIDEAVDRTRSCDATHPGWRVLRMERDRLTGVAWPRPPGDDADGEDSLVPRRPRRPMGSGAIALPLPETPRSAG
jgi:Uma2 family endonuclease